MISLSHGFMGHQEGDRVHLVDEAIQNAEEIIALAKSIVLGYSQEDTMWLRVDCQDVHIQIRAEPSLAAVSLGFLNDGDEIEVLDVSPRHPSFHADFYELSDGSVSWVTMLHFFPGVAVSQP